MRFDQIALLNPSITIRKGALTPFLDMAALPLHGRDVPIVSEKPFTGSGARFQKGDTLIARITPCLENGKGAQIRHLRNEAAGFGSTEFIVARGKDDRDADFIYYLTRHEDFRAEAIKRMEGTSGRQRVAWQQIASIEVPDISSKNRRDIAAILGALDDKIELNRKTAATLEEMARALYRSWFVDFDPVWAKAEGRTPAHMDEATAALFPDSFGDDGMPVGWELKPLGNFLTLNYGKALKKELREAGPYPVYGSGGTDSSHKKALVNEPTIIVGRKGTVGSLFWEPRGCWPIDTVFYVSSKLPMPYLFRALQELPLSEMNTDAAVPGLNRNNAYRLEVIQPKEPLLVAFNELAGKWQEKIDALADQNLTLAALRDTLLPKLMSGELRVGEAQGLVEAVA